jgi:phage regulator Rha-like protein
MSGIPDPGRASMAVEMVTGALVSVAEDGYAITTSAVVAQGTGNQHESVIRLVRDNVGDFEEFGRVRFEIGPLRTAGGVQQQTVAILNEEHATLLMTYLRNNDVVRDFKKRLVREFYRLRRAVPMLSEDEIMHQALTISARRVEALTVQVAELKPKAEFYDELMDAEGCYSMQATANILRWGRNVMMRELRRMGILQGNNLPYRRYDHHFKVIPGTRRHPQTGELIPTATTHVLPAGVEFLRKKLADRMAVTP